MKARLNRTKKRDVGPPPMLKGTNAARRPLTWSISQERVSNSKCTGHNHSKSSFALWSLISKETQCMICVPAISEKTVDFVKAPSMDFLSKIIKLSSLRREKCSLRAGVLPPSH